jgi:L-ascorbate metabolism protein UlaG (beta-lactamase superfamily)
MARCFCILTALLCFTGPAAAQDKKVLIRWHGQSFFEIVTTQGTHIVLDPHAIEEYPRPEIKADLVLMSHLHVDHARLDAIVNAQKAKKINALKGNITDLRSQQWNVIDEKFKDVRIQTMGTYHDDMAGTQRGKNGVFILDFDGLRVVHLGDLGHRLNREQIKKLGTVDVVMIPVGGVYTINGLEAQKIVGQIKPRRYVIPMHYATRVYRDLLDLEYFLSDQEMGTVQKFKTSNELAINPKTAPPKEPIVAILNWEKKGRGLKD